LKTANLCEMEVTGLPLRSSKKWSRCFFHFSSDMPTFASNWKYNPQKRKSDYEKNDANADIAIKNVKIQPTLNVV